MHTQVYKTPKHTHIQLSNDISIFPNDILCKIFNMFKDIKQDVFHKPIGSEFPARLDVPKKVEDHHPGLYPLTARREHEEEEPGGVQHAGGRGGVRPAAAHPGQQLPTTAAHGGQLQEATHHP